MTVRPAPRTTTTTARAGRAAAPARADAVAGGRRRAVVDDGIAGAPPLKPFADHYAASTRAPRLPPGQPTVDTFDEPQMRALHRAYWSVPPTASLDDMVAAAFSDKAFKGSAPDPGAVRAAGRLFAKMPDSFPWGWRSRALAATSHVLVGALLQAPQGTPLAPIVKQLQESDPAFPGTSTWMKARDTWRAEPARFPFVDALPQKGGVAVLEGAGAAGVTIAKKGGGLALNEALADTVAELMRTVELGAGDKLEDFVGVVDAHLGGRGKFNLSTYRSLREAHGDRVPDFLTMRAARVRRLAESVGALYASGTTRKKDIVAALHEQGWPLYKTTYLDWLRSQHPDVVPKFEEINHAAAYEEARAFLDEWRKTPDATLLEVGRRMGVGYVRVNNLVELARARWPDEAPAANVRRAYTDDDRAALRAAWDAAPMDATAGELHAVFARERPDDFARLGIEDPHHLLAVMRAQLDVPTLAHRRQQRYADVFADLARRSPPGTTFEDLVAAIADEHEGAYGMHGAKKQLAAWKRSPDDFPAITKLRDETGKYPWEKAQVDLTKDLAQAVGDAIRAHPTWAPRRLAVELLKDPAFARAHPTFSHHHVVSLRARYPKLVPFTGELQVRGNDARRAHWRAELKKLAQRAHRLTSDLDDTKGLTVASVAKMLGVKPHRVILAARHEPAYFPWYKERAAGAIDLHLATRVAHAMEQAPLSATLTDVLTTLRADAALVRRYPTLGYDSFAALRRRYPDVIPEWHARENIVRSKLVVDALRTAPKGATLDAVVDGLAAQHPGLFDAPKWRDAGFLSALWANDPDRYGFADDLKRGGKYALVGRGQPPRPTKETTADLATRLAKLDRIPERLPLLEKMKDLVPGKPFEDFEVLGIQHLLGSQVALFDALNQLGVAKTRATVVGIPYSVSKPVAETFEDKGWDVRVPPLDLEAWYDMVKEGMEDRLAAAKKSGRKILVLDDGGLVAMLFDKYPHLKAEAHRFTIVEQTRRGITVADGTDLHAPVVNVAQSWGKYVEGPMIGGSVQDKLVQRLQKIGKQDLKGKKVGVIGYGTIGAPLAQYLKEQGAEVVVLDVGADAKKRAKKDGLQVADDKAEFFSTMDVIVGATGVRSMTAEDLALLKDGAVVASASSKLVEIDVEALRASAKKKGGLVIVDDESHPPTVRYKMKDGREIDLLGSGFPINFDGDVEDIAAERIQLTRGLMLIGALQATKTKAASVLRLDPDLQIQLLRAFEDVDGRAHGGPAVGEALTLAQTRLREMKKKHGAREHDRRHGAS